MELFSEKESVTGLPDNFSNQPQDRLFWETFAYGENISKASDSI